MSASSVKGVTKSDADYINGDKYVRDQKTGVKDAAVEIAEGLVSVDLPLCSTACSKQLLQGGIPDKLAGDFHKLRKSEDSSDDWLLLPVTDECEPIAMKQEAVKGTDSDWDFELLECPPDEPLPAGQNHLHSQLQPLLGSGVGENQLKQEFNPDVAKALAEKSVKLVSDDCQTQGISLHEGVSGLPADLAKSLHELLSQVIEQFKQDVKKSFKGLDAKQAAKVLLASRNQFSSDFTTLHSLLGQHGQLSSLRSEMQSENFDGNFSSLVASFYLQDSTHLPVLALRIGGELQGQFSDLQKQKFAQSVVHALNINGLLLKHVPPALISKEVAMAAVNQNGRALEFVPPALKSKELVIAAVFQDDEALDFAPEDLRNDSEVLNAAAHQTEMAIKWRNTMPWW